MFVSQQCRVDGNAWAASGAVAPTLWRCQGSGLSSLVAVGWHVDSGQPLLFLRQPLELILFFRVPSQLDEGAEEVDACHQDDEGHGAEESSQAGLPRHPAAATHRNASVRLIQTHSYQRELKAYGQHIWRNRKMREIITIVLEVNLLTTALAPRCHSCLC